MVRFFVTSEEMNNDFIVLTGENAAHAKVLRIKNGDQVVACDGVGSECVCTVSDVAPNQISLVVNTRETSTTEASVQVSIYMAFSKGDKFEHVIQKATELGATEIVAFPSARCVSKPDDKSLSKKLERWQKIAVSAAQQSGRGNVPVVSVLKSYDAALENARKADLAVLFYENERATTLKSVLTAGEYHSVSMITGREGGLEEHEVNKALEYGLQVCTLGKRILRCETAPLCALSAVMYDAGEF